MMLLREAQNRWKHETGSTDTNNDDRNQHGQSFESPNLAEKSGLLQLDGCARLIRQTWGSQQSRATHLTVSQSQRNRWRDQSIRRRLVAADHRSENVTQAPGLINKADQTSDS
jgi:hypothetical protein